MYKQFFGLRENPFNVNPDPKYLYLTAQTRGTLDELRYGIETRQGLMLLTGEVGTGKTTLLNRLLDWLHQQKTPTAFVFNPRLETSHLFDFILADKGQTEALYFMANENDLQYGLKQAWTSIGLDAGETSLDGPLFEPHTHPRAWGAMPRFLGHYSRDLQLVDLAQAIRKITSMPAQREHLTGRGLLKSGFYADVTIFDPAAIIDRATYADPNQVAKGVKYVLVNGQLEWEDGRLTGATAGRVLRGNH